SGKSTLVRDILYPQLEGRLGAAAKGDDEEQSEEESNTVAARLTGVENLVRVVMVDQSPLGRTPRSNPAVYIGAFEHLRDLFAESEVALRLGLGASSFSFNSRDGQC